MPYFNSPIGESAHESLVPPKTRMRSGSFLPPATFFMRAMNDHVGHGTPSYPVLQMVEPLQLSFNLSSYPLAAQNWCHHVSSTRTTSFSPCGVWKYQHALPCGMNPVNVEYESPRMETVFAFGRGGCADCALGSHDNIIRSAASVDMSRFMYRQLRTPTLRRVPEGHGSPYRRNLMRFRAHHRR